MTREIDIQGHRGARGRRPENTWPAFKYALDVGTPTLELDVVISKDHKVVVSHEPWMSRTICKQATGTLIPKHARQALNIYEMDYQDVASFDCGSRSHPDFPEQENQRARKPLLWKIIQKSEKYSDSIGRKPPVYSIELKSRKEWEDVFQPDPPTFTKLVGDLILECEVADRVIFQSFDPRILKHAHAHYPSIRLAYLLSRSGGLGLKRKLRRLGFTPAIYSPAHRLVNERIIRKTHNFEMRIIPWTVNSTTRMIHLLHLGVDGLITDYPEAGLEAVRVYREELSPSKTGVN